MKGKKWWLLPLVLLLSVAMRAQQPIALYDKTKLYKEALELFEHEKYVPAKEKFEQFIAVEKDPQNALRINSEYYRGICALYLFHKDAEYELEKFVREHPDSPWKQHAYFELATFNYKNKAYKKALEWFEEVDVRELSENDKTEFYYKRGHARFEQGDLANARTDLFEAKSAESEYKLAATYYYSHIAYEQNDLQTALDGFLLLDKDANFKQIVPYYIAQIYYKQKKYDELLAYAPPLVDNNTTATKRVPEICRLIGDAYFIKEKYSEAIPYLERFRDGVDKNDITKQDYYQLGYAYYRTGDFMKALDSFSGCASREDEIGQLATYNMADCYLKLGQKEYARNAFGEASSLEFNKEVQEDAMFNYAKLAFELSYNPFHEAITAFEDYLNKYPNSARRDEAYEFLLNVYMKTRNYEKALASLDKIQNKDARVKEAYQIVAFNRGVELFQATDYANAEKFFDRVFTYPIQPSLNAEAKFWKAEISYAQANYTQAKERYTAFLNEPGAFNTEVYGLGNYGLGYTWFKMANAEKNGEVAVSMYGNANTAFRKFADATAQKDPRKLNDAYLRIGDCFYVQKSYVQAIQYYDKVSDDNTGNRDYAMFQKAICYGYDGKNDQKAWVLKALLADIPDSKYKVDAKFELAKTYLKSNRLSEAKTWYNDIIDNQKNSQYYKRSLADMCLVYVKEGNVTAVKSTWNSLYNQFPNDPILVDAVGIVKSTLIEDPEFRQQIASMKILNITEDDIEAEVYQKAFDLAMEGNCDQAIPKLKQYLQEFHPAFNEVEANYFIGKCYFDAKNYDQALPHLDVVAKASLNNYSEDALIKAATITYNKQDYTAARGYYQSLENVAVLKNSLLEAWIGLLRCNYYLNNKDAARDYANKVLSEAATPEEIRKKAYLWRGLIRMSIDDFVGAIADFKETIKLGGIEAAEAKYNTALIYYKQQDWAKAETECFQLIEKYSLYNDWKYKAFLLLADVYMGKEDYFQARAVCNKILEVVTEQWVRDEAQAKLAEIDALENGGTAPRSSEEDIEINLGGDGNGN